MESVFYDMIKMLRQTEDVILNNNLFLIQESDKQKVQEFLEQEYKAESLNYPYFSPFFHKESALEGAELIYKVAQLILYRENNEFEAIKLLPQLEFEINAGTILSVDLCLRFLPDMIISLKSIDSEDPLIPHLEQILIKWNYSGVNYPLKLTEGNVQFMFNDDCIKQLYLNRIVEYKNKKIAQLVKVNSLLKSNMGMYIDDFWPDFKLITTDE